MTTCHVEDFAVHRVKINKKKKDKHLLGPWQGPKNQRLRVMMTLIEVGELGTVYKGLERGSEQL